VEVDGVGFVEQGQGISQAGRVCYINRHAICCTSACHRVCRCLAAACGLRLHVDDGVAVLC
jgi:hypothetical protein